MKVYSASLDRLAKWITLGVFLVLGIANWQLWNQYFQFETLSSLERAIGSSLFSVGLVLISWGLGPKSYCLSGDEFLIVQGISKKRVNLSEIATVKVVEPSRLRFAIRTFGIGGLFGFVGKYYHKSIGHVTMFASKRSNYVLLVLKNGKKWVITPDDLFLAEEIDKRLNEIKLKTAQ